MAERVGFEPTVEFPQHSLSRRALSTAQTPLRGKGLSLAKARRSDNFGCAKIKSSRNGNALGELRNATRRAGRTARRLNGMRENRVRDIFAKGAEDERAKDSRRLRPSAT